MNVRRIALTLLGVGLTAFAPSARAATPWSTLAGTWTRNAPLGDAQPMHAPPPGPPPMGGASSLVIFVADDGLHVSPDGRRERVLNVDGPSVTRTHGARSVTETVTWEAPAVVVRAVPSEGPMRTESFGLDANGRLVNAVTGPDPASGSERTFRFVYDRSTTPVSN